MITITRKTLKVLTFLIFICSFIPAGAFAATFYVAPDGDDGNDGSRATPWASLSHAGAAVKTFGDRIYITEGSYDDNAQCVLAKGVSIAGAGWDRVTIHTTASPYILAANSVPVVDGSNEIYGITIDGGDRAAIAIMSRGRSNQKIHDAVFANFTGTGVAIYGKYGWDDTSGHFWRNDATASTTQTCSWAYNNLDFSVPPAPSDWAAGVEVYNNSFNDCKLHPNVLSGALIQGNTFNNNGQFGGNRSSIGHTSYWFDSCDINDNVIRSGDQGWSIIAIEMWEIRDCRFFNNISDSWFSLRGSCIGLKDGQKYNYEVFDNRFEAHYTPTTPAPAIEVMSDIQAADIYRNYFTGSAWEEGIAVWGADSGANKSSDDRITNIMIRNNVFDRLDNSSNYGGVHLSANQRNTVIENVRIINNVFDGNRQGINLGGDGGRLGGITLTNNIFMNHTDKVFVTNGGGFGSVKVDTCIDYNNRLWLLDNAGVIAQENILREDPGLQQFGSRPAPYYLPLEGFTNTFDAGKDVGLPFTGSGPDIGAYEYGLNNDVIREAANAIDPGEDVESSDTDSGEMDGGEAPAHPTEETGDPDFVSETDEAPADKAPASNPGDSGKESSSSSGSGGTCFIGSLTR